MPFPAQVIRVMIASPSDVAEERDALRQAMWRWNDLHAEDTQAVLLPVGWETHVRPELGGHPQHLIDQQLADRADVLLGLFWTRLGTPVPNADSGTVHEVQSFRDSGRQVLLYFSTRPMPTDVDLAQVEAVRAFEQQAREWGVLGSFSSTQELVEKVGRDLLRLVRDKFKVALVPPVTAGLRAAPRLVLRSEEEKRPKGVDKRGQMQYSTHTWLHLQNRGDAAAEQVTLRWDTDDLSDQALPQIIGLEDVVEALPAEAEVRYPVAASWGERSTATIVMNWHDAAGESYESRQSLFL